MGKLYQPGKKQITKTIRDAFFGLLLLVLYLSSYFLLWQSTTYLLLRVCTMYLYYPCFLSHFLWSPTFYHFSYFYYFFFIHISNSNFGDAKNNASEHICMYRGKCIYEVLAALVILKNLVLQYNTGKITSIVPTFVDHHEFIKDS